MPTSQQHVFALRVWPAAPDDSTLARGRLPDASSRPAEKPFMIDDASAFEINTTTTSLQR